MDSVQNEFKKHQEKAQNPGAQQPGAAGASSSGPQPGAQNMEDFREEFKQSWFNEDQEIGIELTSKVK